MGEETIAPGNRRRVQRRAVRRDAAAGRRSSAPGVFTAARRQAYLDALAGCCNVTQAAATAGVSVTTVNAHRRRDPAFAQQCEEALAIGYDMLESLVMERAARGEGYRPGVVEPPSPHTVDTGLALHLLQLRGRRLGQRTGQGGQRPRPVGESELNAAILAKLELAERRRRRRTRRGAGARAGAGGTEEGPFDRLKATGSGQGRAGDGGAGADGPGKNGRGEDGPADRGR